MRSSLFNFLAITGISFSLITSVFADTKDAGFDFSDFSRESPSATSTSSPFSLSVDVDFVGRSKINNSYYEGDKIEFRTGEIEGSAVFYYNEKYKEGLSIILDYTPTWIGWKENPWTNQEHFHIVSLGLGGVTNRIQNWTWRGEVDILTDANEFQGGFSYVFYNMLAWGRFSASKCVGLHFGLIAELGMRTDRVYPILGFDWQISKCLKLNAVFPVNVSLEYTLNKHWTFALAGRTYNFRARIARDESSSKSIVRYDNVGVELAVNYQVGEAVVSLHGGSTLGGDLRLSSQHNHHPRHYKLDGGAPYIGGGANIRF